MATPSVTPLSRVAFATSTRLDITAVAPHDVPTNETPLPDGLWELIKTTPQAEGATYTRAQLLAAREA